MRRALLLLAVLAMAGCTEASGGDTAERPELSYAGFRIETTPYEPFEQVGDNHIGYDGDIFGIYAEREDDMPRYTIVTPDAVYTSEFLMGWTQYPDIDAVPGSRAWRLHAWDVRGLIEAGSYDGASYQGEIDVRGTIQPYKVTTDPWEITGDFEPELPYSLTPEVVTLPFALAAPAAAMDAVTVEHLDAESRDAHATIIQWLRSYAQANAGNVPDDVDEDSLVLQRLGADWPTNPFDGTPLHDDVASGHFTWTKCSPNDAIYIGFGWDGSPIGQSFGRGC